MSDKYKIRDNEKAYFVTMTTVGWVDVFTRKTQKLLMINSLKYCQGNKGLVIFAYCLMPNHLHMICKADDGFPPAGRARNLSDIIRDFKTFTSKNIIKQINEEPESRREWMLEYFSKVCSHLKGNQKFKVWQDGNQAKEIFSNKFLYEKLNYIHQNPVEDLIVEKPEDYLFSSARNYAGLDSYLNIELLDNRLITYN